MGEDFLIIFVSDNDELYPDSRANLAESDLYSAFMGSPSVTITSESASTMICRCE
jgi:hypothetical protein